MTTQVGMPRVTLPSISPVFANDPIDDLSSGIRSALGVVSILGGVFGIRYRKHRDELNTREIETVIVRGAPSVSKRFWAKGYENNSDAPPDCWSSNGKVPDLSVEHPVSASCSMCPNDVIRVNPNGMKGKPCSDGKRLAVVPAADMGNDVWGGPMLLSIPAGSLGALEVYGKDLKKLGIPYYAFTTIIRFLPPGPAGVIKLQFEAGRPLTDYEALIIKKHREDERTLRIVNEELLAAEEPVERAPPTATEAPAAAVARPQYAPQPTVVTPSSNVSGVTVDFKPTPIVTPSSNVGGFAVGSKPTPAPAPQAHSAIGEAVSSPATPPPSQRIVQTPPIEEEQNVVLDEVDSLFNALNIASQ